MICYFSSGIFAICILVFTKVVTNYSYYFLAQFRDSLLYKKGTILPYLRYIEIHSEFLFQFHLLSYSFNPLPRLCEVTSKC